MSRYSGLYGNDIIIARTLAMQAGFLAYNHKVRVHYTEKSPARWQGINLDRHAWKGQYPEWADCSSIYTWYLWNALRHFNKPDIVNRRKWESGYTGTLLENGEHIKQRLKSMMRGDAIIYGPDWPGQHVAMYIGDSRVISHGNEEGPLILPYNYRSDILSIRRYI